MPFATSDESDLRRTRGVPQLNRSNQSPDRDV
jgi:hypothetical protein